MEDRFLRRDDNYFYRQSLKDVVSQLEQDKD